jgi:hypothetical protein
VVRPPRPRLDLPDSGDPVCEPRHRHPPLTPAWPLATCIPVSGRFLREPLLTWSGWGDSGKSLENGARGSSALRAAVDAEVEVVGAESRVTVRVTKQRNAAEAPPIYLTLAPMADSVILLPASGAPDKLPVAANETLAALVAIDVPGGVSTTAWCKTAGKPNGPSTSTAPASQRRPGGQRRHRQGPALPTREDQMNLRHCRVPLPPPPPKGGGVAGSSARLPLAVHGLIAPTF